MLGGYKLKTYKHHWGRASDSQDLRSRPLLVELHGVKATFLGALRLGVEAVMNLMNLYESDESIC